MSNYNIVVNADYINNCTYTNKCGMYPTFDILNEYILQSSLTDIMPTAQTSPIMAMLEEYGFTRSQISYYYREVMGYRNCLLPLSKRYPNLSAITNRIRFMWQTHDIVNRVKFERLISALTESAEISPVFNKHTKTSGTKVETPNLQNRTTGTTTQDNDTTVTDSGTKAKTGTEALAKNDIESHSGTDTTNTISTEIKTDNTVNGVTTYDQTTNFYNNDKSVTSGNNTVTAEDSTTYGERITNTGTDTTTYNTTHTESNTRVTDGTITDTKNLTQSITGRKDTTNDIDVWENDISLEEAMSRELALTTILDSYFASVSHDIALYTLEEIW